MTGVGACCSLGFGRAQILDRMISGDVQIDYAPAMEHGPNDSPRGAQAKENDPPIGSCTDRAEQLLTRVIRDALLESGCTDLRDKRVEVIMGTTLGALRHLGEGLRTHNVEEYSLSTTATITRSALDGLGVPCGATTVSAACASGLTTIALGATSLLMNEADLVIAIGYDPISEFAHAGFTSLRLVSPTTIRPFTEDREGMRVGEGAAAFVLERAGDVERRGGSACARLLGWGAASDAHHLTQPAPDGSGAARALRSACQSLPENSVPDLMVAHATSTPANDAAEYQALKGVLGNRLPEVSVTAMKSRIGHTLGAAGAVETAVAIATMERGVVPSCAHAVRDEESFPELDLVIGDARPLQVDRAGVISLGFGGADASILIESPTPRQQIPPIYPCADSLHDVVITGFKTLVPEDDVEPKEGVVLLDDAHLEGLDNPRAVRRLSRLAKLVRAAGFGAAADAGLSEDQIAESAGFVASRFGAVEYTLDYYEEILRDGHASGNPLYFAESVPNIGSAQLSLGLGLTDTTISIGGTRIAALEAMHLARRHISSGQGVRAFVIAAEEATQRLREILSDIGLLGRPHQSCPIAEGSVGIVLEQAHAAHARGARILAHLEGSEVVWPTDSQSSGIRASARSLRKWRSQSSSLQIPCLSSSPQGILENRVTGIHSQGHLFPERHAVGPILALCRYLSGSHPEDKTHFVMAGDESGGASRVNIC